MSYLSANYHSKFPIIKKTKDPSADSLILTCKLFFQSMGYPKETCLTLVVISFQKNLGFCKSLNVEQALSSSYHHQSNGQVEACIKFVRCTLKKCFDSRSDLHIPLLQIRMMPLGLGLPSPATMLFKCLI